MDDQLRLVRFGAFEVDFRSGELRKYDLRVRLQDQPFKILTLLLERAGEVVTREELHQKLWPADTFVDFDVGLNSAIKRLRDALCDSTESPRYIETLPRKGYRFIAEVEHVPAAPSKEMPVSIEPAEAPPVAEPLATLTRRRVDGRIWMVLFAATLVLVVAFNAGGLLSVFRTIRGIRTVQSVAVLPLENLSGDATQDYFVDGMTEALINDLGKVGELRVISRTSVMPYKGTKKSLQQIASELHVDALVEGTVSRSGNHVRITANLIQASPERHLWADSFERDLRDVLTLQDDVSRAIANGIQVKLTPQEQTRLSNTHTPNPESYDAYLEGRYFLQKMNGPTPDRAQQYFEAAIQKDPAWALPYSGLAEVDMVSGANAPLPNDECKQAKELAMQSLRLDSTAAENHTVLADVEFFCEWNWVDAEKEAGRAIELNPNYARARSSRARYLLAMDRTEEALNESKRAVELDPLSFRVRLDRWTLLFVTAHYPEALQQCRSIQELELNKDLGQVYCGDVDIQQGKFAEGIQELERAVTMSQTPNPRAIAHLGFAYAVAGRRRDAENELAQLESMMKRRHVHPDLLAGVYAGLGQREQAFNWLEKAYEVRARDLLELKYDPRFASLHPDPRFNDLLRRIGVAKDSSYHK